MSAEEPTKYLVKESDLKFIVECATDGIRAEVPWNPDATVMTRDALRARAYQVEQILQTVNWILGDST